MLVPLLVWVLLKFGATQQFHSLPKAYMLGTSGDTTIKRLPNFTLTDHTGKIITAAQTRGYVYVVGFFAKQDTLRWRVTAQLLKEAHDNADAVKSVRFLTIAARPDQDSMPILKHYADSLGGKFNKWLFATGSADDIKRIADSLGLPAFRTQNPNGSAYSYPIVVLLDKDGIVRGGQNYFSKPNTVANGHYDASRDLDVRKLKEDMRALLTLEYPKDLEK